MLVFELVD